MVACAAFETDGADIKRRDDGRLGSAAARANLTACQRSQPLSRKDLEQRTKDVDHSFEAIIARLFHIRLDRADEAFVERVGALTDGGTQSVQTCRWHRHLKLASLRRHRAQEPLHELSISIHQRICLLEDGFECGCHECGKLADA